MVTKSNTGTLARHKSNPRWRGSKKLHNGPVEEWCPGGGLPRSSSGLKENQKLAEQYPILQYFKYAHLPPELQVVSASFCTLAWKMARMLPRNPETSTMLRKLLEAKDAAVRAYIAEENRS